MPHTKIYHDNQQYKQKNKKLYKEGFRKANTLFVPNS